MLVNGYYGVDFADPSSSFPSRQRHNLGRGEDDRTPVNRLAVDHVVCAPLALVLVHSAWRKNVSGIVQAPKPLHRGVNKTV